MVNLFPLSSRSAVVTSGARANSKIYTQLSEKSLYKAISADKLLSSTRRQELLKSIKEVAAPLPNEYYDTIYLELIRNFVSFVQILPVNNEARLASLMDEGLLRALYALQVWQKSSKEEVDLVLSYVVFSALLLFDIACVAEKRTIILSEEDGSFIRVWDPYHDGAMADGDYYKVRRGGGLTPWSSRRSVIGLAISLMPAAGFNWIYKNAHAFNIWLALLADDKEGAGALRFAFEKALEMLSEKPPELYVPLDVDEIELDTKQEEAEKFIEWVKNEAVNGNLKVNTVGGDVYYSDGRTLITMGLVERYLHTAGQHLSFFRILINHLHAIGLISSCDGALYTYGQQKQGSLSSSLFGKALGASGTPSANNAGTFTTYSVTEGAKEWFSLPSADKNSSPLAITPINKADRISLSQQQLQSLDDSIQATTANVLQPQRFIPNASVRY